MLKEGPMFILLICLCLCSFSDHVLAATTASERMSSVNTEKALVNPLNTSLIQQVMPEFLFLLKKVLTYKVLLIAMSISMIYILYENDNTSLQHKSSKPHKKNPSNQQQRNYTSGSFGSSHPSERQHQSDNEKRIIESRQSQMTQTKNLGAQHQQKSSNVSKEETPERHQPDVENGVESLQSQMVQTKDSETQHQHKSSNISKEETPERHQPDVENGVESLQSQMVQTKESETSHQQKALSVSKKEGPNEPFLSQKKLIPQGLEREHPKRREKFDHEHLNIRTELPLTQYIQDGQHPGNGWIWTDRGSKSFWVYIPVSQQGIEGEYRPILHMIPLSNSFIPHTSQDALWINPKFYTKSDLAALVITSKYAYIQFKKLPADIVSKMKVNSYMLHTAYKTCVIDVMLRTDLIKTGFIEETHLNSIIGIFERCYVLLLDRAKKKRYVSYEFFREVSSFYINWLEMTVKSFLTLRFLEKRQWTLEYLQNSKDALKEALIQAMKEWTNTRNYNFIPQIHKVDPSLYEGLLKRMHSLRVPFCNCRKISQLLVSSRDEPLKLFLFWDIFNMFKIETLSWGLKSYDEKYPLKDHTYANRLFRDIPKVYSNQNGEYLKDFYFELVDDIQRGFFRNNQLYKRSQTDRQHQDAFDDYMLDIKGKIELFLTKEVFIETPVAIRVENS